MASKPALESTTLWLDPSVLQGDYYGGDAESLSEAPALRAYEMLDHAERRVSDGVFGRVDAIASLKRAVDQRLRLLQEAYAFKTMPLPDKPSHPLAMLEYLGMARRTMIAELLDLRNRVEHRDETPPTEADLRRMADLVWYFLRSTDVLARTVTTTAELFTAESSNGRFGYRLTSKPPFWVPHVEGWFSEELFSDVPVEGHAVVWGTARSPGPDDRADPTDRFINGEVRGPAEFLRATIVRLLLISYE